MIKVSSSDIMYGVGNLTVPATTTTLVATTNTGPLQPPPTANYQLHIAGADSGATNMLIDGYNTTPTLNTRRSNGTSLVPTGLISGSVLFQLVASGYGTTQYLTSSCAKIAINATETWTDSTGAANMSFFTRASGSAGVSVQRMILLDSGNIGLGNITTNMSAVHVKPRADYTLVGTTTTNASTTITGVGTRFTIDLGNGDRVALSSSPATYATVTAIASDTSMTVSAPLGDGSSQTITAKKVAFQVNSLASYYQLMVDDQGLVGINLIPPLTYQLEVNGTIRAGTGGDATNGVTAIGTRYTNTSTTGGFYSSFGTLRGGATFIGDLVGPDTVNSGGYVSTTNVASTPRAAIEMSAGVTKFKYAAAQTTAIGSTVTLTESMRIDTSGLMTLSGNMNLSPASGLAQIQLHPIAGQNATLMWNQVGQTTWTMYNPGSSSDIRLSNGSSDMMTLTSSGDLTFLKTGGSSATAWTFVYNPGFNNATGLNVDQYGASAIFTGRRANGTFASPTATTSGFTLAGLQGAGYHTDGTPGFSNPSGSILILSAEGFTSTANGTNITFSTTPTGSSAASIAERMRIFSSGVIGLGTSTADGVSWFLLGGGNTTPVSAGSTVCLNVNYTAPAASTSNIKAITGAAISPANTSVNRITVFQASGTVGASGSLTKYVGYVDLTASTHVASASAAFSDTQDPPSNFFIYQTGSDGSRFGGLLTASAQLTTNLVNISGANGVSPASAGQGQFGATASDGLEIIGNGSTRDVTIFNNAGSVALGVTHGTVNLDMPGQVTIHGNTTITANSTLQFDNNANILWKESGGTARNTITLNGSNNVFISGATSGGVTLAYNNGNVGLTVNGTTGNITALAIFNNTTASAANVFVDSAGLLWRSTSALKYKKEIKEDVKADVVHKLRPVTYQAINEKDKSKRNYGFIAEELEKVDSKLVHYSLDGVPEGVQYERITVILVKAVQELKESVKSLKDELNALKASLKK